MIPPCPTKYGALSIPITGPDGERRVLSSSTISAKMLKEIKEYIEGRVLRPVAILLLQFLVLCTLRWRGVRLE
jgi:hypothetical protein